MADIPARDMTGEELLRYQAEAVRQSNETFESAQHRFMTTMYTPGSNICHELSCGLAREPEPAENEDYEQEERY